MINRSVATSMLPFQLWAISTVGSLNRMISIGSSTRLVCQIIGGLECKYYRITNYDILSLVELTEDEAQSLYNSLTAVVPVATMSYEAWSSDLGTAKKLVIRECGECPFLHRGGGFGYVAYIPSCDKAKKELPYTPVANHAMVIARLDPGIPAFCPLENN